MQRNPGARTRTLGTPNLEDTRDDPAHTRRRLPRLVSVAWLATLTLGLAVVPSVQAGAGPCRVPSSTYLTIQAAVENVACTTVNVAAGIYYERITIDRDVIIRGAGQDSTVVDGSHSGTVVTIASGTVTIQGVTTLHGRGIPGVSGGGIYSGGTLTIQNSTVADNLTGGLGGGIWNVGTLTVRNSMISDNEALGAGGIYNTGTLTIQNSTLSGNSGPAGAGGIYNTGTLIVQNSTFSENGSTHFGGGIANVGNAGTLTIQGSTFSDNDGGTGGGGGIYNQGGVVTIENS